MAEEDTANDFFRRILKTGIVPSVLSIVLFPSFCLAILLVAEIIFRIPTKGPGGDFIFESAFVLSCLLYLLALIQ